MRGGRILRAWAMAVAAMLALYGVLPQLHLVWDHAQGSDCAIACASACAPEDGQRSEPADPEHPSCATCQAFLAAPALDLPAAPPEVDLPTVAVQVALQPSAAAALTGVVIRWPLARGPPRA